MKSKTKSYTERKTKDIEKREVIKRKKIRFSKYELCFQPTSDDR